MFLRSVHVKNLRSLRSAELSFRDEDGEGRKWTLLIGENGTGKSTLLRALGLAMVGSEALPEILGDPSAWVRHGAKQAEIEVELATAEGDPRTIGLTIKPDDGIPSLLRRNARSLAQLDRALKHTARSYLTVGYGVSRRLESAPKSTIEESLRHPRARALATLFRADQRLHSVQTWAMDLEYRHGEGSIGILHDALDELLPGMRFAKIDRQSRRLLFTTPDGLVPLENLSDGYQSVAAWIGDLLHRITETFEDYRRPLEARGVLLIDELELHLHPIWQRRLRTFLSEKLPNFQIIATTHAALTAQQAGQGELFYLRRQGKKAEPKLEAFAGDPQKLMLHQLLLSDVFGLPSLNSPQIEAQRERYRVLRAKRSHSAAEKREMNDIAAVLEVVPDWSRENQTDLELVGLLRSVKQQLSNGSSNGNGSESAAPTAKRAKRSRKPSTR
ncbi:MAG: AAA family ATPase [Planctomycetes bacterium]|nr:AAA family ATPase [Planctomycetota bacterium]